MKLIPSFFRFFSKNLPLFRWGIVILFVVSCVLLFWFFPKPEYLADGRSRFEHYTHIDKFITIFQIANGKLSSIYGYEDMKFQIPRLILPFCFAWGAIEISVRIFIRFFTWCAISRCFCGHVIVFGIGEKGFTLVKELLQRKHTVVAIDKKADNPYLEQIEHGNGFTLVGDATDINFLKTLGLHRATAFYAMTGDDTINIESAIRLKEYFQTQKISYWNRLWTALCGFENDVFSARIQVNNPILRRLTWEQGGPFFHASISENTKTPWMCYPFSAYDLAAKTLVEEFSPDIAEGKTKPYHVVIVGFGWFGERLALQLIRMCQTPKSLGQELIIHIIDSEADLTKERFYQRYPAVDPANAEDPRYGGYAPLARINFIQGDAQRMNENTVRATIPDIDENTVIYVCLADELQGAETAMSLARITRESGTRIVFALPETERLAEDMQETFKKYNVSMFFPLSISCSLHPGENHLGETVDNMGKAVLRAYDSKQSWANEPEWGREASRQSASHVFFKLRMVGVNPKHIETISKDEIMEKCRQHLELLAEAEHDRWAAERLLDGWIYDGDKKDPCLRLHHDIQPFTALNKGTQDIDFAVNKIIPEVVNIWQKARK